MKLNTYFKETQLGTHDARPIAKHLKAWLADELNIKVVVKKESSNPHYGGSVSGGTAKTISLNITTDVEFDIVKTIEELRDCQFKYLDSGSMFARSYVINLRINNVIFIDRGEDVIGKKFRERVYSPQMLWNKALHNIDIATTFYQK